MASEIYIYIYIYAQFYNNSNNNNKKKLSNLWIQPDPTDPCGLGWVEPL